MDNSLSKTKRMETENLPKLLLKYSSVTFFALFFSSLYNIADALFVSYGIGDAAMAGVSVVYPFMILQGAFAQTVGSGAGTLVSKFLGEKNYKKAGRITASAMAVFYATSALTGVLCIIFSSFVLRLLGAEGEIYSYAKDYLIIIASGNIFSTGFSSVIRAEGRMGYSLLIWFIPTLFNILADYVLIFVFDMGVKGAALATVISQFISFFMSIVFFSFFSCQKIKESKPNFSDIKNIVTLGIPVLLQTGGLSVIFLAVNKCLSLFLSSVWVSSFAYVGKIATFFMIPFNALIQASSPIISYNYGAGNQSRISKTLKYCVTTLYAYSVPTVILIQFLSRQLMNIFTKSTEIVLIGSNALNVIAFSAFFLPPILIISTYYQSVGNKKKALVINLLLIITLTVFIVLFALIDCEKIWYAVPVGCFVALLQTIIIGKKKYCTI